MTLVSPAGTVAPRRTRAPGGADTLAAMVGVTVCLLPLLTPAGPGNTAAADAGIAGCLLLAALWTTREHVPVRVPYAVGVAGLVLGGAIAANSSGAPASVGLVLVQDAFLLAWAAVVALGRHDVGIIAAATHAWCRTVVVYCAIMVPAYLLGIDAVAGVSPKDGARAAYTFADPNLAANYLVVSLLVMAACQRPRSPGIRLVSYGIVLVAIAFTGSNGAMLSLLLAAVLVLAATRYRRHGAFSGIAALISAALAAVLLLLVVIPAVDLGAVRQDAAGSIPLLRDSGGRSDGSSSERETILVEGYGLFLEGNATGIGPARTKATLQANQAAYVKEAHNDYLATLLERGVIGVVGLVLLALTVAVRCSRILVGRLPAAYAAVVPRPEILLVVAPVMALSASFYEVLHFRHLWTWLGLIAALSMVVVHERRGVHR